MGLSALKRFGPFAKLGEKLTASVGGQVRHAPPIAIDFGVSGMKLLQLEPGDQPKLVAAAHLVTPDDLLKDNVKRLDYQLQNLPKLVKQGGFKGRRVVCTIPAWMTAAKCLQVPKTEGTSMKDMIEAALPAQLGVMPGSIVYRSFVAGTTTTGMTEVLILAAARDSVDKIVKGLLDAKLEPVGMQSEYTSLLRSFDHITRRDTDANLVTIILDVGQGATKLVIAKGKELAFARLIEIGGRHLDALAAKQLSCNEVEARRARHGMSNFVPGSGASETANVERVDRRSSGSGKGLTDNLLQQPAEAMGPESTDLSEPLEILTDEILMSVRYFTSQLGGRKPDRVLFVGGEALSRGVCQKIAKQLRTAAQSADPVAWVAKTGAEPSVGVDLKQPQPGWAAAMGLALSPTDL
jgi:type IV pilus assembly protein PilM